MLYYYHLLRFHVSNQMHIRNRARFDKSWQDVLEKRRRLRLFQVKKSYFQKIKEFEIFKYL